MAIAPLRSRPRVALIGVSGYGRIYHELLKELWKEGTIDLTAAAVIEADKDSPAVQEMASLGCRIYCDYREMLDRHRNALDLCAIPTGIPWHTPMTLAALAAGAHVLVEKPIASTLAEVRAVQAAEAAFRRTVMVGFQYLYQQENRDLQTALIEGAIGKIRRIRVLGLWPRAADYYARTNWAGRTRLGKSWVLDSPVNNAFAHHLSLALFFAGTVPKRSASPVRVAAELYRAQRIENYDTAALRIDTNASVPIHFYASHSSETNLDPELVIDGDAGKVVWRHVRDYRIEPEGRPAAFVELGGEQPARRSMFQHVLGRLSDPSVFVCGSEMALEHTRCVQAAQAAGSVRDVPSESLASNGEPELKRRIWIRGLEPLIQRAFSDGVSLAEAGCPWAQPPGVISVADEHLQ